MNVAISLLSTIITFVFVAMMLDLFLERRRMYQAVWTVALALFGLGVLVEFLANLNGWSVAAYRWWFLFGATFAAVTLGLGSVYLLLPERWARGITGGLLPLAVAAVYRILTVPIDARAVLPLPGEPRPPSVQSIPADITLLVVLFNSLGTLAVVAGAVWSAWVFVRRRRSLYRALSNLLIATGALVVASSGSLAGLGRPEYLFIGELSGIALLFAGFLRSQPVLRLRSLPLLRHLYAERRMDERGRGALLSEPAPISDHRPGDG